MEQNNFEKNIQYTLDELKIPPSDSVWANVEKSIGKKDKKRKYAFLLLFLFLILASGGIWWFNSETHQQQKSNSISVVSKKSSKPTNAPDSSLDITMSENNFLSKSGSGKTINGNSNIQNSLNKKNSPGTQNKIHFIEIKTGNSKTTNKQENYFKSAQSNPGKDLAGNITSRIKKENITHNENAGIQKKNTKEDLSDKSQKTKKETVTKTDSINKNLSNKIQKHNWNFGITFSGGNSFVTNHSSGNNVYSDPLGNISNGGVPGFYYEPSELKNSTAFIAGVFAERNIFDGIKISVGISYQFFYLMNKVGNAIPQSTSNTQYLNSSNRLYSSNNIHHSYRNQFHFIEVPVAIKFRLNKNKSVPIFWNAGINISELISSNALQFQPNPGIYYKDNSLFHKTQFGLNTGVLVMLFAKEKNPLTVGPYFHYNPTNIASKGLYQEKHFSSIGIQANILFRKK